MLSLSNKFITFFMLLLVGVFFACSSSSSEKKEEKKSELEEAQEELNTHFSQEKAYTGAVAEAAVGTVAKGSAVAGHQGYKITKDDAKKYYALNITENGEYVVMHNDKSATITVMNGKKENIEIEKQGDYSGDKYTKYLVFDYTKPADSGAVTGDKNIPYLKIETTSADFKIAFRKVGEDDHDDH